MADLLIDFRQQSDPNIPVSFVQMVPATCHIHHYIRPHIRPDDDCDLWLYPAGTASLAKAWSWSFHIPDGWQTRGLGFKIRNTAAALEVASAAPRHAY